MKIKAGGKVKASTLTEVLVSMVIMLAVFTIAISIYSRVSLSGLSLTASKAQSEINRIIAEAEEKNDLTDETLSIDSINYSKTVEAYASHRDLFVIAVMAEQNGKIIGQASRIIRKEDAVNAKN